MNKKFFNEKVVIITGSSKGIGKTIAMLLGSYNAKIVLNARNRDVLQGTEQELKNKGYDVISVAGDITNEEDCIRLINESVNHFGKLDVLVNNAGVAMRGSFADLSSKVIINSYNLNCIAPMVLTRIALPYIKKAKGNIIFISSLAGLHGLPHISVYSASKMALTAITQSMRVEHHSDDIHIGLAYVGITENEPGKTVMNVEGESILLGEKERPFETSVERVAYKIAGMISSRKKQIVIGISGKIFFFLSRYFPGLLTFLLIRNLKKMDKIYK